MNIETWDLNDPDQQDDATPENLEELARILYEATDTQIVRRALAISAGRIN